MEYQAIQNIVISLSYRDKLRLAQLLIQLARKEEEEQYVKTADSSSNELLFDLAFIKERLLKSKPSKLSSLENFINAMFQFRGSITESERNQIITSLKSDKFISIDSNKITYL